MKITNKFTELYHEYKLIFHAFVVGLGLGALITVFIFIKAQPDIPVIKPSASVSNISGSPLRVDDIKSDKDNITLHTSYDGQGQSNITIPSQSVPSAFAWDNYRWSVCGGYMTNKTILAGVGYRYERLTVSGGGFARIGTQAEAGIWCMASWSFKSWW